MTDSELQTLVEEISLTVFKRPFCHHALFNRRLKTTGGRYHLNDHHLDFNPAIIEKYGLAELIGVIKHELCHYHLHLTGGGYRHKDADFKRLLAQSGGTRYAPPLVEKKVHCYYCEKGHEIFRQRKLNTKQYVCGICHGKLQYQGLKKRPLN